MSAARLNVPAASAVVFLPSARLVLPIPTEVASARSPRAIAVLSAGPDAVAVAKPPPAIAVLNSPPVAEAVEVSSSATATPPKVVVH